MNKKILFIDQPLDPPGGGQMSLFYLIKQLLKEGIKPVVFIPYPCSFKRWLEEADIEVKVVPAAELKKEIRQLSPELIHCNAATTRYTFHAALIARMSKIPFIWHVRVLDNAGLKDHIVAFLSTKIIAISDAVALRFKGSKKVIKVHNVIDTSVFHSNYEVADLKLKYLIGRYERIVGVFSRLDPWKGHELFLETAHLAIQKVANIKFLIVGDGDAHYKEKLKSKILQLNLQNKVIFTGFTRNTAELMNLCDCIVNPSVKPEPFGRTIIEGMACRKAVIGTNFGGPREIIQNGVDGLLVEPNKEQLNDAIQHLLRDRHFKDQIASAAQSKIKSEFSIEKQASEIKNIYQEYLN